MHYFEMEKTFGPNLFWIFDENGAGVCTFMFARAARAARKSDHWRQGRADGGYT